VGPRGLRSWQLAADLARMSIRAPGQDDDSVS